MSLEEIGVTHAYHLIDPLTRVIKEKKEDPEKYKKFDSSNGWGTYKDFLPWLKELLEACKNNPQAEIRISR